MLRCDPNTSAFMDDEP